MGKNVVKILAENLNRLCVGQMTITEVGKRAQIGKSTIDRVRKAETAMRIDNLEDLARVFGLQAWQLLVPNVDPQTPPVLVHEDLGEDEYTVATFYQQLDGPERRYILEKIRQFLTEQEQEQSSTSAKRDAV